MQLALGAFSSVFGGGGASSGALSAAAGFAKGLSLLAGIGTGLAQAGAARAQADQVDLEAGQEKISQENRAAQARRQLLGVIGDNRATYAASGIDITSGIAATNEGEQRQATDDGLSIDRRDTEFKMNLMKQRASQLRKSASMGLFSTFVGAATGAAEYGMDMSKIGGLPVDPWNKNGSNLRSITT